MVNGIINIILGAVAIAGGATGKLTLLGTGSSTALIGMGIAVASYGAYQVYRNRPG